MKPRLDVVAGIIQDNQARFLLSQRPAHKHQGGRWEFPGGKVEPGETPAAALSRELEEELGIQALASVPFMTIDHDYPDLSVRLMFRQVTRWHGEPHGREQQPLGRFAVSELSTLAFPAANRPVVTALQLPERLLVTPPTLPAGWEARLGAAVEDGARLVYARLGSAPESDYRRLAEVVHAAGGQVLVADDVGLARAVAADGLHLTHRALQCPWPDDWTGLRSMACHDAAELKRANQWQADLVTLSPVRETPSHPQAQPLGWEAFSALASGQPFPVYALGGVTPEDLAEARQHGARGVAGIRAFW